MKSLAQAFATIQQIFLSQFSMRITQTGFFEAATGIVISSVSGDTWIFTGAHLANKFDNIVVLSGPYANHEFFVTEIVSPSSLKVAHRFQDGETVPLNPVTVRVMRPVSAQYNSSGGLTVVPSTLSIIDFPDTPLFDASSTNIPKSSSNPLQIVLALSARCLKIKWGDDIGEFIGIYTGLAAAEVLIAIVPPGGIEIDADIPAGTRISIRHMKDTDIVASYAAIHFLG